MGRTRGLFALTVAFGLLGASGMVAQVPTGASETVESRASLNLSPVFTAAGATDGYGAGGVLSAGGIVEWIAGGGIGARLEAETFLDTEWATGFGAGAAWQFSRSPSRAWYVAGGLAGIYEPGDGDGLYTGGFGAIGIVWRPRRLGLRGELRTVVVGELLLLELRAGLNFQAL